MSFCKTVSPKLAIEAASSPNPVVVEVDSGRPGFVSKQLVAFLNAGDMDGLMGLYEDDALYVDLDGAVTGLADIRAAHRPGLPVE